MTTDAKYFAIFGDVHGHFRLMFQLCRHWQRNSGVHLDGILLCGDIGFSRTHRVWIKLLKSTSSGTLKS